MAGARLRRSQWGAGEAPRAGLAPPSPWLPAPPGAPGAPFPTRPALPISDWLRLPAPCYPIGGTRGRAGAGSAEAAGGGRGRWVRAGVRACARRRGGIGAAAVGPAVGGGRLATVAPPPLAREGPRCAPAAESARPGPAQAEVAGRRPQGSPRASGLGFPGPAVVRGRGVGWALTCAKPVPARAPELNRCPPRLGTVYGRPRRRLFYSWRETVRRRGQPLVKEDRERIWSSETLERKKTDRNFKLAAAARLLCMTFPPRCEGGYYVFRKRWRT